MGKETAFANLLKKTAVIVLGIILAAGAAEFVLRLFPRYKFAAMTTVSFQWNHCEAKPRYRPSRSFGFELIPNSGPDVNSFGMRDKEYTLKKPKGVYRILLLGDSICEYGRWSDYVEEMLVKYGRYELLNAATGAWGMLQYCLYLKEKGMKFDPDLVLIGFCINDVGHHDTPVMLREQAENKTYFYSVLSGPGRSRDITLNIDPFLFEHSTLYRFIAANFFLGKNAGISGNDDTLREMKSAAGGKLCAVVFPYLKPLKTYDRNEETDYKALTGYLKKTGIDYLDLTPFFNGYGEKISDFRNAPQDQVHYNDAANRLKAKLIYDWLKKEIKFKKV